MTQKRPQCGNVAAAFAKKPIGETVAQLVWGELPDARALADTLNHAPKRLLARRQFRVFAFALPFVLRDPLLDLNREEVFVELRLNMTEARPEAGEHVRSERDGLPVRPLSEDADAPADQVHVCPAHMKNLCPPQ